MKSDRGAGRMDEEQTYRDYRLVLSPEGEGWKVLIYEPGASRERWEIPVTTDPAGRTHHRHRRSQANRGRAASASLTRQHLKPAQATADRVTAAQRRIARP